MSLIWGTQAFWRNRLNNQTAASASPQPQQQPASAESPANGIEHLLPQNDANGNATTRDKKTLDPLFGPNIGAVTSGPAWTASADKKLVTDDLTPDVVSTWVEKSRDPSQPTTTLQALVNLKRPTIKLSPLHPDESDPSVDPSVSAHPHGLEFEYDCDSPKCGLYVHVYLPKNHPDAPPTPPHHQYAKLLVFESVVDGGFGKQLKLDEGAVLELGHFDLSASMSEVAEVPKEHAPAPVEGQQAASVTIQEPATRHRRRFTAIRFRRGVNAQESSRSISGPALAVVDAEPQENAANQTTKTKNDDEGVRVVIRIAALDEQGTELANVNEQVTYLHIVRVGSKPEGDSAEDTRPWVVKVVKREATIGAHTFHLHEIYGLTSTTSKPAQHVYPPVAEPIGLDDDPQSECLLCLSSPREVVLLPCRHLVACKECALNMVEFGAGGNITQSDNAAPSPPTAGEEAPEQAPVGDPLAPLSQIINGTTQQPPAAAPRRKRKAKGWFCPVCRQPYTSLLRITTAPPPFDPSKVEEENPIVDGLPTLASLSIGSPVQNAEASPRVGFMAMGGAFSRPNFLRSLTGRGQQGQAGQQQQQQYNTQPVELAEGVNGRPLNLDVENAGGLGRPGS